MMCLYICKRGKLVTLVWGQLESAKGCLNCRSNGNEYKEKMVKIYGGIDAVFPVGNQRVYILKKRQ